MGTEIAMPSRSSSSARAFLGPPPVSRNAVASSFADGAAPFVESKPKTRYDAADPQMAVASPLDKDEKPPPVPPREPRMDPPPDDGPLDVDEDAEAEEKIRRAVEDNPEYGEQLMLQNAQGMMKKDK